MDPKLPIRSFDYTVIFARQMAASLQLAFRVAPGEVASCADTLRGRGVQIVSGPTDQPFGHRTLFLTEEGMKCSDYLWRPWWCFS